MRAHGVRAYLVITKKCPQGLFLSLMYNTHEAIHHTSHVTYYNLGKIVPPIIVHSPAATIDPIKRAYVRYGYMRSRFVLGLASFCRLPAPVPCLSHD